MNWGLSMRFMTLGAEVPQSRSAGLLAAFTKRWKAFSGMVNSDPFCHSNACFLLCPSCQTSVEPRPSTTNTIFLVEVPLDIQRAGAGDLHDIATPKSFGAVELYIGSATAQPAPRSHRQILHPPHADAAIDRDTFCLHETVIGHRLARERAETGVFTRLRFMPMDLIRTIVHVVPLRYRVRLPAGQAAVGANRFSRPNSPAGP